MMGENLLLKPFLTENDIEHKCTCPYTPEQNKRSEQKLRHIVEIGLTLLTTTSPLFKFWVYICFSNNSNTHKLYAQTSTRLQISISHTTPQNTGLSLISRFWLPLLLIVTSIQFSLTLNSIHSLHFYWIQFNSQRLPMPQFINKANLHYSSCSF